MARKRKADNPSLLIREGVHRMLHDLPDEEAGKLVKALTNYRFEGVIDELSPKLEGVFLSLRAFADLDAENYKKECDSKSEAKQRHWDEKKAKEKAETTSNADSATIDERTDDTPHPIMQDNPIHVLQGDPVHEYDDDDIFG